jgi:NitT/TauT family transport system permease protein
MWEFGSGTIFDPFFFSSPSQIFTKIFAEFFDQGFYKDLWVTSVEMGLGYLFGALGGIITGILLARWPIAAKIFEPILIALNSIPRIALAPLMIVWFGIDLTPKIVLAATLVYFLTFFNTFAGIRNVDTGLVNVARVQGANDWQIFAKIMLPGATVWIMTGLKMSLPFALIGVIVGEFLAASAGLGYRLNFYSTSYNTTGTMTMLIMMMFFMMLLNTIVNKVENRLLRWRPHGAYGFEATP